MAVDSKALGAVGGFDTALGAGTMSLASEDTRALTDLLLAGGTVVYQPSAITYHFHRGGHRALRRQMHGYGAGLTAFYTSILLSRPGCAVDLLRLGPNFARAAFGPDSLRGGDLPSDFPTDLRWANRRGLLEGPIRYLTARALSRWRGRTHATADRVEHGRVDN